MHKILLKLGRKMKYPLRFTHFKGQLPENIEDKELEWNRKFVTQKGNPGVAQPEVDAVTGYIY